MTQSARTLAALGARAGNTSLATLLQEVLNKTCRLAAVSHSCSDTRRTHCY